ncbi:MAG: porin family protein [Prosthecochloris sp.]|nr:porin family protein [Prosthecochloris sp.]
MKKVLSLIMVFMVAVMFNVTGYSAEKYVSGNIGITWFDNAVMSDTWTTEYNNFTVDFDSGITFAGAYGADYGDYRAEVELGYQKNDIASSVEFYDGDPNYEEYEMAGDMSMITIMGNAYYDISLSENVDLFLTAGAGAAFVSFSDVGYVDDIDNDYQYNFEATAFAYQIGAGLSMPLADNIMIDARYRYFALADFTIDDTANFWDDYASSEHITHAEDISSHSMLVGLRVTL